MTFKVIPTTIGEAKIAAAIAAEEQLAITHMAVGDGNGADTEPDSEQIALVNEVYRFSLNQLHEDSETPGQFIAEGIVPPEEGGWFVREVGLFDDAGDLIYIANFPSTYKPATAENSERDLVIRLHCAISSTEAIELIIDPSVVVATRAWVLSQTAYSSSIYQTTKGVSDAHTVSAPEHDYFWFPYHSELGDAGGGLFYKDRNDDVTPSDGGCIVVDSDGFRLRRMIDGEVRMDYYGIDRTGVDDESASLSAAIDYAIATGVGVVNIGDTGRILVELEKTANKLTIRGKATLVGGATKALHLHGDRNLVEWISVEDTSRNQQTLWIDGVDSYVMHVIAYNPSKSTATSAVFGDLIRISGDRSAAIFCEAFNGHTGIHMTGRLSPANERVYGQSISMCHSHDNVRGCTVEAECSGFKISMNDLSDNDVNDEPGSDGLWCESNVTGGTIERNLLNRNGEHGLYFQGDNTVVHGNTANDNGGSGLKFGGKKVGNFNDSGGALSDEAYDAAYVSRNVIVSSNICERNGPGSNAGIYLQETHDGYLIETNICRQNQGRGIAAVNQQTGGEIQNLSLEGNISKDNDSSDLYISVTEGLRINGGDYGNVTLLMPDRIFEDATINDAIFKTFTSAGVKVLKVNNLTITENWTTSSADEIHIRGGEIHFTGNFDMRRVMSITGGTKIVFDVNGFCTAAATCPLERFMDVEIEAPVNTSVPFQIPALYAPINTVISGVRIKGPAGVRAMDLYGDGHTISGVVSDTNSDQDIVKINGDGCTITGCASTVSATARISLSGNNNIAVANQATVISTGTGNIRTANRDEP